MLTTEHKTLSSASLPLLPNRNKIGELKPPDFKILTTDSMILL
jgi:hypothetical protein